VEIPVNHPDGENTQLYLYFFSAWTLFSHRQKNTFVRLPKGAFYGLI
jgi:hypothetical protein